MFVECRSFSDLSNRSAAVEELPLNATVNIGTENTLTEVANGTFDAGDQRLNETEILSTESNITFNCNEVSEQFIENETQEEGKYSVVLENNQHDENEELDKTPTNVEVQAPLTVPEAIKSPENSEAVAKLDETAAQQLEVVAETQETPTPGLEISNSEATVLSISSEAPAETLETPTQEVETPTQEVETPTEEVETPTESELQESIKSMDSVQESNNSIQEPEVVYRNIDEIHSSDNSHASQTSAEESAEATPVKFKSPETPKLNENVFVEKMQNQFDVEFKMPSAPVFKQPHDGYSHEEFKACASSCKISISGKKLCKRREKCIH